MGRLHEEDFKGECMASPVRHGECTVYVLGTHHLCHCCSSAVRDVLQAVHPDMVLLEIGDTDSVRIVSDVVAEVVGDEDTTHTEKRGAGGTVDRTLASLRGSPRAFPISVREGVLGGLRERGVTLAPLQLRVFERYGVLSGWEMVVAWRWATHAEKRVVAVDQPLNADRETAMAQSISRASSAASSAVAVVGARHVAYIREHLSSTSPLPCTPRTPPLPTHQRAKRPRDE
eukprot:Sspe_Gene.81075::Locus_51617_Transcript_1_1_Confidence_1.000_Length_752::g.81075::m.81075